MTASPSMLRMLAPWLGTSQTVSKQYHKVPSASRMTVPIWQYMIEHAILASMLRHSSDRNWIHTGQDRTHCIAWLQKGARAHPGV